MKDESGVSRGFGFVMFVQVQDAINAINALNGKLVSLLEKCLPLARLIDTLGLIHLAVNAL